MEELVIAATGHRPPRLGLDYTPESNRLLTNFAKNCLVEQINDCPNVSIIIISGVAQGWDQAIAHSAIHLGLPLVCAVPFEGQELKWPPDAQKRYNAILAKAKKVEIVCPGGYAANKFIKRDKFMVDACELLLALFDGNEKTSSGTWETIKYARKNRF